MDVNILQGNQTTTRHHADITILWKVVKAVRSPKWRKSPGVDNVPAEMLRQGWEETTKVHRERKE